MFRVQLSLNVTDFDAAVAFYSRLFGTAPASSAVRGFGAACARRHLKAALTCPR